MKCLTKSLVWASLMIAGAITAKKVGLSDTESMFLIFAMIAAFFATQDRGYKCGTC